MRTAILDEPARGLAALLALAPSELPGVLAVLGAREAQRIVETLAAPDVEQRRARRRRRGDGGGGAHMAAARRRLVVGVDGGAGAGGADSESLRPAELPRAARLAAAVAAWQRDRASARAGRASSPDAAAFAPVADSEWAPDLAPLLALAPAHRRALAVALGESPDRAVPSAPLAMHTRFGGLLLLVQQVADLALDDVWPHESDLRLRTPGGPRLARAAGVERSAAVVDDPVLRRILGVAEDVALDDWLVAEERRIAAELPSALAERPTRHASSFRLAVTRWPGRGAMQIAVAEPDGYWLAIAPLTPALRSALRAPPLLDDPPVAAAPTLPTAHALRRTLAHVALPSTPAPAAEPALAVAAQQTLLAFARRLPGFAESSPRFLYDSFLDFDATVVESDGRFHCRTGRPRLAALLAMTGTLRGRTLIRVGATSLELYPGG